MGQWTPVAAEALEALFDLHDLTATIHAGLQVDVMRTVQFSRCLVLDIGIILERIMGAAHIALGACDFGLWNGHGFGLSLTLKFPAALLRHRNGCCANTCDVGQGRICRRKPGKCQPKPACDASRFQSRHAACGVTLHFREEAHFILVIN